MGGGNNKELKKDVLASFILFGASPNEYFLYGFPKRSLKERDEFLTDAYRTQLQKVSIGLDKFKSDLLDKYHFYEQNTKFFGRECMKLDHSTTFEEFASFVRRNNTIFIKDNAGSFGAKAHVVRLGNEDELQRAFSNLQLATGTEWIAEGWIRQDDRMAVWNKTSVNTIRIPSILVEGKSEVLMPFIRTGREGAVVDNAGAGGIFAVIDEKTGKIVTDGADEQFNRYDAHPDCRIKYKGWQVPEWDKVLEIAERAHKEMPEHKYIAYDFALTPKGWVMVEGNWGQYICQQTATQIGAKSRFKRMIMSK